MFLVETRRLGTQEVERMHPAGDRAYAERRRPTIASSRGEHAPRSVGPRGL
jgi:hypothetical protein